MAGTYLRLKFERQRRHWSQTTVGELVQRSGHHRKLRQADISEIELGRRIPTESELEALARVFCISPASLLLQPVGDEVSA